MNRLTSHIDMLISSLVSKKEMALSLTQVRNNKATDWKDLLEEDDKDV